MKNYGPEHDLANDLYEAYLRALEEALNKAKNQPPPQTVVTYLEVFGHWPAGWPPWE
jgi:hypothetical protein